MPLTTCTVSIAADARPTHLNTATMTVVADRPVYYSGSPVFQTPAAFDPAGTALPHVNQAGLVDGNGDPVTEFAYIVTGELAFEDRTGTFSTIFQVFTGQSTYSLSLLREPDVAEGVAASAAAALESANDAAASAAAANAPTDAQVGTSLASRGLPTTGSELSASIDARVGAYKAWAKNPDQLVVGSVTYSSSLLSSAAVVWPDGATGTLTITSRQAGTDAVTGYTITRVTSGGTQTYTQPTITRDSSGNATTVPQITVA